ncbi:hypothetical protein NDU88_004063 [Pleurodeles waltl]|uniref:Uncharacterized protein n=1 Tax=Pleurodeles waltl TaxID=8319 RepID=A0AAV7PCX4_PLEWA|nr:hypothetical protein NDU88_004063 [Pleurodeles waltl]
MPMVFGAPIGTGQRRPRATPRPTSSGAQDSADPGRGGATGPNVFPTKLLLRQFGITLRWADFPPGAGFRTSVCGSTWVRALASNRSSALVPAPEQVRFRRFTVWGGGGASGWSSEVGEGHPWFVVKVQQAPGSGFRVTGPVDHLLVVRSNVSRGSEGADLQRASLYASYLLRSRCPSQCIGVRAPAVWSAEPRGPPAPESPILSAADRASGRPLGPPLRRAGWRGAPGCCSGSPGLAPPVGVSMPFDWRSRPEGGSRFGRGLVPGSVSLPDGCRHSRPLDF